MSDTETHTLACTLFSDNGEHKSLSAVIHIDLIACAVVFCTVIFRKACLFCFSDSIYNSLALIFRAVEEILIFLAVYICFFHFIAADPYAATFLIAKQLFFEESCLAFGFLFL